MEKIRLIALDVDGTLLDDRKELPAANREALAEAAAAGIPLAIASGRVPALRRPVLTEIDPSTVQLDKRQVSRRPA